MTAYTTIVAIFVIAWCVVLILAPFYSLYESARQYEFQSSFYERGRIVLDFSERFTVDRNNILVDETIKTKNGRFKFINERVCLFAREFRLFSFRIGDNVLLA